MNFFIAGETIDEQFVSLVSSILIVWKTITSAMKYHLDRAIECNPEDNVAWTLLGHWYFEVRFSSCFPILFKVCELYGNSMRLSSCTLITMFCSSWRICHDCSAAGVAPSPESSYRLVATRKHSPASRNQTPSNLGWVMIWTFYLVICAALVE